MLMGQNGSQLWLRQGNQRASRDDDGVGSPGDAVGGGFRRVDDDRIQPLQPTADQTYGGGVPVRSAAHAGHNPRISRAMLIVTATAPAATQRTRAICTVPILPVASLAAPPDSWLPPRPDAANDGRDRRARTQPRRPRTRGHFPSRPTRQPHRDAEGGRHASPRSTGGPTTSTTTLNSSSDAAPLTWPPCGFALRSCATPLETLRFFGADLLDEVIEHQFRPSTAIKGIPHQPGAVLLAGESRPVPIGLTVLSRASHPCYAGCPSWT